MLWADDLCKAHSLEVEKTQGIPGRLLHAISKVETGHKHQSWPWAVRAEGKSHYFETRKEAITKINALIKNGIKNIDVGCMQINVKHHMSSFDSVADLVDPKKNIEYAAKYLKKLRARHHSWTRAIGYYHSATRKQQVPYRKKVYRMWMKERALANHEQRNQLALHYASRTNNHKQKQSSLPVTKSQNNKSIQQSPPSSLRTDLARFRDNVLHSHLKKQRTSDTSAPKTYTFQGRNQPPAHSVPRLSKLNMAARLPNRYNKIDRTPS